MAPKLDHVERRRQRAVSILAGLLNRSDREIGELAGIDRATVQACRTGGRRIRAGEVERFAVALGVPAEVIDYEPTALLHWAAENIAPSYAAWDSNPEPTDSGCPGQMPLIRAA